MSSAVAVPADDAPSTPQELVDWELSEGDAAAHLYEEEFYIVARTHAVAPLEAVPIAELREDPEIDTPAEAIAAVERGAVDGDVVPERWLVPLMEAFIEAEHRGEWSGVRDYLRGQQEVSD